MDEKENTLNIPLEDVALTTSDNPYSPFTQFTQWYNYDEGMKYRTCELLSRVIDGLKEIKKNMTETEIGNLAMMQIVKLNLTNIDGVNYKIVKDE